MKNLVLVTLLLENGEAIAIPRTYIGQFLVEDIKDSVFRVDQNIISHLRTTDTFVMEINQDFDKSDVVNLLSGESYESAFDRIHEGADITAVILSYDDETDDTVFVPYQVEDGSNKMADIYISDLGHMYIVVSSKKQIEDYFKIEDLNNELVMSLYWAAMRGGIDINVENTEEPAEVEEIVEEPEKAPEGLES